MRSGNFVVFYNFPSNKHRNKPFNQAEEAHVLIIQGVAGSERTSIALHRIAYLLYAFKGSPDSGNILILLPNRVFAGYISNVLPELDEETVPEMSMEQVLSGILDDKYKYYTFFEQVNELLLRPSPDFIARIEFKASFDFISQLNRFILHVENTCFKAADVQLAKHITVPAAFIAEQFRRFNRYPVRRRFEQMTACILELPEIKNRLEVTAAERNRLKKEIRKMFTGNNDLQLYKTFFTWPGKPGLFKTGKGRTLEYADPASPGLSPYGPRRIYSPQPHPTSFNRRNAGLFPLPIP